MNAFDLEAKITLDTREFKNGLQEAKGRMGNFAEGFKKGFAKTAKVAAAGFTAITAGIAKITKDSVAAYADYEQLVGGVDTLFKQSSDLVQQYAANAYKTAGVSANEYMETVTAFSASLIQSLGGDTEKAAEVADLAMLDMADNANKMGTAMESVEFAYKGFARGNYMINIHSLAA